MTDRDFYPLSYCEYEGGNPRLTLLLEVCYDSEGVIGMIFSHCPHLNGPVKCIVTAFERMHPSKFEKIQKSIKQTITQHRKNKTPEKLWA